MNDTDAPSEGNAARPEPSEQAGVPEPAQLQLQDAVPSDQDDAADVEQLERACRELEERLAQMLPMPTGVDDHEAKDRLLAALGRPPSPAGYVIEQPHDLIAPDATLNERLHAAGFTQAQAQLVYDLAAEHVLPMAADIMGASQARRDTEALASHFGGDHAWREVARQLKAWGTAHLDAETFETLASSFDGVVAMHTMMAASEPAVIEATDGGMPPLDEDLLAEMVRDPRYWRDRDPDFVARVTNGFKRLYG